MPAPRRPDGSNAVQGRLPLLVALALTTAGCTAAMPVNTPPPDIPPQPPQYVCGSSWDVANGTVTVTITKGPQVTLAPGAAVTVRGDVRNEPHYWISGDERPAAAETGPLGPGDEITIPLEDREGTVDPAEAQVRVIWSGETGSSALLCEAERQVGGTGQ